VNTTGLREHRLGRKLVKWGLVLFFATQVVLGIPNLQTAVQPYLTVPYISYAEKMHIQWGRIFDLMDFIRRETPENAVILMNDDGRPEFDQYFLFPRRVIYGDAKALLNNDQIEYVLVNDGYPPFPVDGIKIMLDDTHGMYELHR
jgi:hypothetical protein